MVSICLLGFLSNLCFAQLFVVQRISRVVVLNQGYSDLIMSGDIFRCHWVCVLGWGGVDGEGAAGVREAGDADKYPAMHSTVPLPKELSNTKCQ